MLKRKQLSEEANEYFQVFVCHKDSTVSSEYERVAYVFGLRDDIILKYSQCNTYIIHLIPIVVLNKKTNIQNEPFCNQAIRDKTGSYFVRTKKITTAQDVFSRCGFPIDTQDCTQVQILHITNENAIQAYRSAYLVCKRIKELQEELEVYKTCLLH